MSARTGGDQAGDWSPELLEHLAAEREWYDVATAHLGSLSSRLRSEMESRVPAVLRSGSWSRRRFSYYTEDRKDREYAVIWRESRNNSALTDAKSAAPVGADDDFVGVTAPEVVLDINTLDAGTGYLDLGLSIVSPDESLLAYSVDTEGDERFVLRFRDLRTGQDLPDVVAEVGYTGAWTADSRTFLYTVPDEAWRSERVRAHRLGTDPADDLVVLAERDRRFEVTVRLCRSGQAIVLLSESRQATESWYVDPADPALVPRSLGGRREGVEYRADHVRGGSGPGSFLLVTNDGAEEFRLMSCPVPGATGQGADTWTEVRPEDPAERLERVDAFAGHVVASMRRDGASALRILSIEDLAGPGAVLTSRFTGGELALARNTLYDADDVAVIDESRIEPPVHARARLADAAVTDDHRDEAPGHDPSAYVTEVRTFPAPDGTRVPATVIRHRDTPLDGTAPALLFGYGAYEYSWEREWEEPLPSLLDRGAVFVHAHVRGGGEGGRRWWVDGRLHAKQHTFDDLVGVADGLVAEGLVDPTRIATRGLSAGGLLQGAVFSQRPGRWRAVLAEVPFVDVVTSMSDDTLPLTVGEWEEWGDPSDPDDFAAMLGYSPYDNPPPAGGRPDLLVTGAVHDTRVLVHEPAKWVARLRETDPAWSATPMACLYRAELGTGSHVGPSGKLGHLAYEADVLAWLLDRLGLA
jgi:oligopeptidase B